MLIVNPRARMTAYDSDLKALLNMETARENRRWLSTWPYVAAGPTPIRSMPNLAARWDIGRLSIKDESVRSSLGSFKALGAPVALLRLIRRVWPQERWRSEDLLAGRYAEQLREFVIVSATDGNHGMALAAAAQSVGCRCVILLHAQVNQERAELIGQLGAEIVRVSGDYDESVRETARYAEENHWHVVSDTSYVDYEDIPRDVMQGYATIADELIGEGDSPCPFTHVILQGGVGGLAAGIISHFWERYGSDRPRFVVVEPVQADCLLQSALLGRATVATGSVNSVMAGLACGAASPLAWRFIEPSVDYFMTIEDEQAVAAMRVAAAGEWGDVPVLAGESGAAGLAAAKRLTESSLFRQRTGLNESSHVLAINTEGATAPRLYERLSGYEAQSVLAAQARWVSTAP